MPAPPPRVRVVVQLPYNRPENPIPDPPHIEWNAEKANILWEVIALSRTSDNGGTDWKGLAAHLQVPLPYLLYRAQARYEEDLRGLQDIRGVLNGSGGTPSYAPLLSTSPRSTDTTTPVLPPASQPLRNGTAIPPHGLAIQIPPATTRLHGASISARRLSTSGRVTTPLGVRARLNSLTHRSPVKSRSAGADGMEKASGPQGHGRISSSSVATLQGTKRPVGASLPRAASPFSPSDDSDSEEDEEAIAQRKEEEAERAAEEREGLEKKLEQLTRMMTSERVGLLRSRILEGVDDESGVRCGDKGGPSTGVAVDIERTGSRGGKGKEREIIRGRPPTVPAAYIANTIGGPRQNVDDMLPSGPTLAMGPGMGFMPNKGRDHSASVSSASSPQGSIPSIPSPPPTSLSPGPSSPRMRPLQNPPRHSVHPPANAHAQAPQGPPIRVQSQGQIQSQIQNALSNSPMTRHLPSSKSSSPPAVSVRNAHGHTRVQGRGQGGYGVSEGESNHGSSASSFSDLSDASLSASALESALMSNIRGAAGSRFSAITRSKFVGRGIQL